MECSACSPTLLLGHPDAKDRVILARDRGNVIAKTERLIKQHCTGHLFGENLSSNNRRNARFTVFFQCSTIGDETTNDLDELIIFGSRDQELRKRITSLIGDGSPFLNVIRISTTLLRRYIRGDINSDEETSAFLGELAAERRRVFRTDDRKRNSRNVLFVENVRFPSRAGIPRTRSWARSRMGSRLLACIFASLLQG